jgi:hypothetical protein
MIYIVKWLYTSRNQLNMDEGGSKKSNSTISEQRSENRIVQRYGINASSFLQSFWVRCRSIFPTTTDGKFMEGELRIVLYCGVLFWMVYLFWEIIK